MPTLQFKSAPRANFPADGLSWSSLIQTWQQSHDNPEGSYTTYDDNPGNFVAGYSHSGNGINEILRSFFNFNLAATMPVGAQITSAKFKFFTYNETNLTYGFDTIAMPYAFIRLVEYNPISTSTVQAGDYSRVTTTGLTVDLPFSSINLADAYTEMNFNAAGIAYLQSKIAGVASLAARDGYDVLNVPYPNETNFQVWINFSENQIDGTCDPQRFVPDMESMLEITYSMDSPSASLSPSASPSFSRSPSASLSPSSSASSSISHSPSPSHEIPQVVRNTLSEHTFRNVMRKNRRF